MHVNGAQKLVACLDRALSLQWPRRPDHLAPVAMLALELPGMELVAGTLLAVDVLVMHFQGSRHDETGIGIGLAAHQQGDMIIARPGRHARRRSHFTV